MEGARLPDRHRPLRGLETYVDLLNGFGPTAFGHAPDFVREAHIAQIDQGYELGPQTPLAGEVASSSFAISPATSG
jgi:glutamate-1-semialdehyde aminotransferase